MYEYASSLEDTVEHSLPHMRMRHHLSHVYAATWRQEFAFSSAFIPFVIRIMYYVAEPESVAHQIW